LSSGIPTVQALAWSGSHHPDLVVMPGRSGSPRRAGRSRGNIDDQAPLLRATYELLALADCIRMHVPTPLSKPERETWVIIDKLTACYERDRPENRDCSPGHV
jgi:hypothetical protein